MLTLKKMTKEEFKIFSVESKFRYMNDKIRANSLTMEEAQRIADVDFERILSDSFQSKDNFLFTQLSENATNVGYLEK